MTAVPMEADPQVVQASVQTQLQASAQKKLSKTSGVPWNPKHSGHRLPESGVAIDT